MFGPPGIGKTSFGAAVPGRVFLVDDQEDGIGTLKASRLVAADIPVLPAAQSWPDVLGMLKQLEEADHDYKSLVVDTTGGMERLCHDHVCCRDFNGDWGDRGFASYAKGYEVSLPDWREFLNGLDRLRTDRNMSVVLLAHSLVKPYKNPIGEDYDRYIPDMHHKTWSVTHKWADMVLFANYYVEVMTERGSRPKGRGGQVRQMHTEYHAAFEAKNRHALPEVINMGSSGAEAWANLTTAIKEARKAVA